MVRRTGMAATAAVAVLICAGCGAASSGTEAAGAASSGAAPGSARAVAASADAAMAATPTVATMPTGKAAPSARRTGTGSPSAAATAARSSSAAAPVTSAPATAAATRTAASAPVTAPAGQGGTAAAQVLALINQARSAAGLPALTITAGLETSSSQHNLLMAGGCGLSHQCPGEPPIGERETDAGVDWTAAGENIGEGGPVADTDAAIAQMAVGLTQSMLNEQPPDDGHRLNILSSSFTHIGVAVYRDSSGTVWLTQDFSN